MNHLVLQAEEALTHAMVAGTLDHERLQTVVRALDRGAHSVALTDLCIVMQRLADDRLSSRETLCLALDHLHAVSGAQIADLQLLALGFYRTIWRLLARIDPALTLAEIRALSGAKAIRLCYGFSFDLPSTLPLPAGQRARIRDHLVHLFRPCQDAQTWSEGRPLPLGVSLSTVPDNTLGIGANAIRNAFFDHALDYLATTAPPALLPDALIIDLLRGAATQPRRLPFLAGLSPPQARFRVVQLALGLIALHQVQTTDEPRRLLPDAFLHAAVSCLLTPVSNLRGWLRLHRHAVRIPVVRMMPEGDPLVLPPPVPISPPRYRAPTRRGIPALT